MVKNFNFDFLLNLFKFNQKNIQYNINQMKACKLHYYIFIKFSNDFLLLILKKLSTHSIYRK